MSPRGHVHYHLCKVPAVIQEVGSECTLKMHAVVLALAAHILKMHAVYFKNVQLLFVKYNLMKLEKKLHSFTC